jgi:hypothetical protein
MPRYRDKKNWKKRLAKFLEPGFAPYWHHFDLRPLDDLDDEGLAIALTYVKGIDMLDLNYTEITNKGIQLLTKLEYIKELRLKEVRHIDNGCIDDLNKITSLEFLHVRYTGITIDGILKLNALTNLKRLMFSEENVDAITDKMLQLKAMLPGCEFIINSRPYQFEEKEY